jgi:hypothetical protein
MEIYIYHFNDNFIIRIIVSTVRDFEMSYSGEMEFPKYSDDILFQPDMF